MAGWSFLPIRWEGCVIDATLWKARLIELMSTPRVWGGLAYGHGDITHGLIQLCCEWIKPDFVVAEVGSFRGVSTRVLALFAHMVYAVDPWTRAGLDYRDVTREMLTRAEEDFVRATKGWPNIVRMQGFSLTLASHFADASLDAVYIDGDHRPEMFQADVRAWLPKLKSGGLLMGHDHDMVGRHLASLGLPKPAAVYPEESWVVKREGA